MGRRLPCAVLRPRVWALTVLPSVGAVGIGWMAAGFAQPWAGRECVQLGRGPQLLAAALARQGLAGSDSAYGARASGNGPCKMLLKTRSSFWKKLARCRCRGREGSRREGSGHGSLHDSSSGEQAHAFQGSGRRGNVRLGGQSSLWRARGGVRGCFTATQPAARGCAAPCWFRRDRCHTHCCRRLACAADGRCCLPLTWLGSVSAAFTGPLPEPCHLSRSISYSVQQ